MAGREKINIDRETLQRLYFDEKKPLWRVAEIVGCSVPTVVARMDEHGMERRRRGAGSEKFTTKKSWPPCVDCGDEGGDVTGKAVTPIRVSGELFGIEGKLCKSCYDKHYMRMYRRNKKDD